MQLSFLPSWPSAGLQVRSRWLAVDPDCYLRRIWGSGVAPSLLNSQHTASWCALLLTAGWPGLPLFPAPGWLGLHCREAQHHLPDLVLGSSAGIACHPAPQHLCLTAHSWQRLSSSCSSKPHAVYSTCVCDTLPSTSCLREKEKTREGQASVRAAERRCGRAASRTRAPARCATTEKQLSS
jgi:hypothetical protein